MPAGPTFNINEIIPAYVAVSGLLRVISMNYQLRYYPRMEMRAAWIQLPL